MWAAVNIAKKNLENTFAFALHDSEGVCRAGRVQGWSAPSSGLDCVGDKLIKHLVSHFPLNIVISSVNTYTWNDFNGNLCSYTSYVYMWHVTLQFLTTYECMCKMSEHEMRCNAGEVVVLWACVSCPITSLTGVTISHAPDTGLHPAHPAHTTPPSIYVSINLHKVTKIYLLSIFCPV